MTLGGVGLAANATEPLAETPSAFVAGDKYEAAAALTGKSVNELKHEEAQQFIKVTDRGHVVHIDSELAEHANSVELRTASKAAPIPGDPAGGSLPGAPVTIYLDFGGETVEGTEWNRTEDKASMTFTPASAANAGFQQEVWAAVAEDYAPFNVNVTTTDPGADALFKSSADDPNFGSHVVITDSYDDVLSQGAGSGGIAFLGGAGSHYLSPAFVFASAMHDNPAQAPAKSVAEAASHEAGHNFGLEHDGIDSNEYFNPDGGLWGPVMGAVYHAPVSQWSIGDYNGATNQQDDLAVITDRSAAQYFFMGATLDGEPYLGDYVCALNGADPQNPKPGDQWQVPNAANECDGTGAMLTLNFEYTDRADARADSVGNDAASATVVDNASGSFEAEGVIINRADVDVYRVNTSGGEVTAKVDVAEISPNLDAKLTLTDSSGATVAENDPAAAPESQTKATGLDASLSATGLAAGTYYLTVDGVGTGDPGAATPAGANGYTDYGSLGNYSLSGTAAPAEAAIAPVTITSPADGASVPTGTLTVTGKGEPGATVKVAGPDGLGDVLVDGEGNWTMDMPVSNYGTFDITATQEIDGSSATVKINVTIPAPVVNPVANVDEGKAVTVTGKGVAGATVTVTYTRAGGTAVVGEATVAADGTWSLDLGVLPVGEYTVLATQALDGQTSGESNTVSFAVVGAGGGGGNDGGNGGGGDGELPTTGGDSMAGLALGAIALLAAGAGAGALALRRSKAAL